MPIYPPATFLVIMRSGRALPPRVTATGFRGSFSTLQRPDNKGGIRVFITCKYVHVN